MNANRKLRNVRASRRYRKLRKTILRTEPLCRRCKADGFTVAADELHHIEPIAKAPERAFDPSNLEPLCWRHHHVETVAQRSTKVGATVDGDLIGRQGEGTADTSEGDRRSGEGPPSRRPLSRTAAGIILPAIAAYANKKGRP